jgi:hypothetical protein
MGTDFTTWSEKEIVAFLDRRGEDHDDCIDAFALVERAKECEHNTGVPIPLQCEQMMPMPLQNPPTGWDSIPTAESLF